MLLCPFIKFFSEENVSFGDVGKDQLELGLVVGECERVLQDLNRMAGLEYG